MNFLKALQQQQTKGKLKAPRSRPPKPKDNSPKKSKKRRAVTSETTRGENGSIARAKSSIAPEDVWDEAPQAEETDKEIVLSEPEDDESNGSENGKQDNVEERRVIEIDKSSDEWDVMPAPTRKTKKCNTKDLLTIFLDQVKVRFIKANGEAELLTGRWCDISKADKVFVKNKGKRRAFHIGGNSSCRQHI
ncbi:hypothetical protein BU15DRAFT_77393 [Melanogaster broomeanus]|nr:hypothetical protein BU15DRAFT_77393 [Melanogaster broomeanus]